MTQYVIVNNVSRAANYGVGTYLKQLENCLSSVTDLQISMIDMDADTKEYSSMEDESGYTHYLIPRECGLVNYNAYLRNTFYYLAQQIKCEDGDFIIFHFNYFQYYQLAIRLKAYVPSCKIIMAIHYLSWCFAINGNITRFRHYLEDGFDAKEYESGNSKITYDEEVKKEQNLYNDVMESYNNERQFLQLADTVIVLSNRTRNIVEIDYHISPDKITVIHNGLEDTCEPSTLLEECRDNSTNKEKNVLFVGRLDNIKGVHYLIKAFKILYEEDHSLHLYLVGDGDFSGHLSEAKGIWDAITITGKTDKNDTELFYKKATVGVLPSFHEQCSYSAIEMMMHGVPLVGTDSTGLGEMLVCTPENIVHIDEESFDTDVFVEDLSNKIKHLLEDCNYRTECSKLVRQEYLKMFSLDMMKTGYCQLLDSLRSDQTVLSEDMLQTIDEKMFSLINSRPEIDLNFFGMTGIGHYLWRRIVLLYDDNRKEMVSRCLLMQEYLIYYLDWVYEEVCSLTENERMMLDFRKLYSLMFELQSKGFYKMCVKKIINMLDTDYWKKEEVLTVDIYSNALRIFNYDA